MQQALKIATWNVNSLKLRSQHILDCLKNKNLDLIAIQEIKTETAKADLSAFSDYYCYVFGQKSFNGVAIISKFPLTNIQENIPQFVDNQARVLSASYNNIRIINVYAPNGQELNSEKFHYKIDWFRYLVNYVKNELQNHKHLLILGDFNIAPSALDSAFFKENSIFHSVEEQQQLNNLKSLGLDDCYRLINSESRNYTWWDYRGGAWQRNLGMRIDLIFKSKNITLNDCGIFTEYRNLERPSDHAPVWAEFQLEDL